MAVDRLLPVSTTPGAVDGDAYMDAVQEEVGSLWDKAVITLSAVAGTNTITATCAPAFTAGLVNGMMFILKPAATNTSTVTLNVNGGGAIAVVDAEGTALTAGALRINANYLLKYDATFVKYSIVGYVPAATIAVGSKLLRTQAAAASASLDFVHGASGVVLDNTYDTYELVCSSLLPATDDVELWLRVGTGGGPTYQTTNYKYAYQRIDSGGSTNNQANSGQSRIIVGQDLSATAGISFSATEGGIDATIRFSNPESGTFKNFWFNGVYTSQVDDAAGNGRCYTFAGGGMWASTTAVTAIRLMFESGNITSGRATLYGITKA
jgi:hypothetical protein